MPTIVNFTATDLYKWVAYGPCRVLSISGFNPQTQDCFVQFHERSSAPSDPLATSTVPTMKSFYAPGGTQFSYGPGDIGEVTFAELTIAVSTHATNATAQASYQPHGGSAGLNFSAVVDTSYPVRSGITTMVGDLATTGRSYLRVWDNSATYRRLLRLDIVNGAGTTIIPFVQSIGGVPCIYYKLVNTNLLPSMLTGVSKTYQFGPTGGQVTDEYGSTPASLTAAPSTYAPPGRSTWTGVFGKQYAWTKAGSATILTPSGTTSIALSASGEYIDTGGAIETGTSFDPVTSTVAGVSSSRGCVIGIATAIDQSAGISTIYHRDLSAMTLVNDDSCGIRAIYE